MQKEDTRIAPLQADASPIPSQATVWKEFALYYDARKNDPQINKWWKDQELCLNVWDDYINDMIRRGYLVELIGVNPQVRASIKRYRDAIIERELRRQTDRQTDNLRIVVPEYNPDIEHNNADEEEDD